MLQIIFKPTFISLLLVFSIDLSCTGSDPQDKDRAKNITINMVTHGQASDPFWSVVSNGAKAAAEDLGIRLVYQSPQNFDMVAMSQIIDAVIATDPDGLVLSVPDIPALKRSISSAVKKNIPIIVINSGSKIMEEMDILTYVGQSEYEAGESAAQEILKQDIRSALCINHEVGNISLDQRERGFRNILKGHNVPVRTIPVDASDPSETRELVRTYLASNPDTDAILTLGPLGAIPVMKLLREMKDSSRHIKLATFDFTPEIIDGIMRDDIIFALDQQQYLQGYLPVTLLYLFLTNKNTPAYKKLQTGPSIITKNNALDVLALSKKGTR